MNRKALGMRAIGLDRGGGDGILVAILFAAGLELVRAPEGYLAIWVKPVDTAAVKTQPSLRWRQEGRV